MQGIGVTGVCGNLDIFTACILSHHQGAVTKHKHTGVYIRQILQGVTGRNAFCIRDGFNACHVVCVGVGIGSGCIGIGIGRGLKVRTIGNGVNRTVFCGNGIRIIIPGRDLLGNKLFLIEFGKRYGTIHFFAVRTIYCTYRAVICTGGAAVCAASTCTDFL